ncbi:DUF4912 domain-containing protein [Leptolyngbya sp. 7M]|uniref:DUF4912 domain-containing protein n=1 Tax=Leptolyngbya sp. 7M TaxID=2812896 RepID=UPI001B8C496A|nr:DUF4912 domain-containing protein [Leptolyngbya sp. 7M]QYO67598.1 DUF4912 domain-containing protein [Leptolyngbya sp. 7M]
MTTRIRKDILDADVLTVSSGEAVHTGAEIEEITERIAAALNENEPVMEADPLAGMTPVFRELALPKLPQLKRENRARLQMQTPNRLYFYWSLKNNPYQILHRVFGQNTGSYTLILKLINTTRDREELHAIDAEGNWWFNVEPDSTYRAEIGFYAPNRPYFRALYSNEVTTPRKGPSSRVATEADWRIPSQKFAEVLDVSGFKQDAFNVAIAGDNAETARDASFFAVARLVDRPASEFEDFDANDILNALTLLAGGATLEDLRFHISEQLFAVLQSAIDRITRENALAALKSEFDIDDEDLVEEQEEVGPAVFGSSLVNFPKRSRTRERRYDRIDKFGPISSSAVVR